MLTDYDVTIAGKHHRVEVERAGGRWQCWLDGCEAQIDAVLTRRDVLSVLIEGKASEIKPHRIVTDMHFWVGSGPYAPELSDPRSLRSGKDGAGDDQGPKKL